MNDPVIGLRIKVARGPWPERYGCIGTIVAPPADGTYPQPSPREVLILLDDDPIPYTGAYAHDATAWTCVIGRNDIELLEELPTT